MGRHQLCRRIRGEPGVAAFKPEGIPAGRLECVHLALDELEAIRLADLEGLYQEDAAEQMRVSRQTFGRIVGSARRKVAEALVQGKAILVEGGNVHIDRRRTPPGVRGGSGRGAGSNKGGPGDH